MQRAFVSNILLLILINVLIKPFFIFGIDLAVQNETDKGAYGLYFALLNWAYLFQIISDFGLQNFNTRHVSRFPHLLAKYFPNLLLIKLLLSVLYFGVALLLAWGVGRYHAEALGLLAILLVNQILVQMTLFLRSNLSGLGYFRLDSWLSSLDKLLMLLFCGAALWAHHHSGTGPFPILWFVLAQTLALALTTGVVYGILNKKAHLPFDPYLITRFRSGWPVIRLLFRKSWPYALVILLMSAYTRLDSILLERLLPDGAYHTDVFAGGFRLLDALNMFGYLFASLLLPMFARLLRERLPVEPLANTGFRLIWTGSWTAAVAIFSYRVELMEWMFSGKTDVAYRAGVSGILIWCFVAVCTTYIFSTLLTADERLKEMNRFFAIGIGIDLGLNLWLIPAFQAYGAAIAALSTQVFVALGMVVLCLRHYRFKADAGLLLRWAIFSGGVWLWVVFGLPQMPFGWLAQFAAAIGFGGVWALLTGWVQVKKLLAQNLTSE